jgi:hypothetical protein
MNAVTAGTVTLPTWTLVFSRVQRIETFVQDDGDG